MTDTEELDDLIRHARQLGAMIFVTYEPNDEGRKLYQTVRVENMPRVGPHPMSPISAAEALRRVNREVERQQYERRREAQARLMRLRRLNQTQV